MASVFSPNDRLATSTVEVEGHFSKNFELLKTGKYSDLTIRCEDCVWRVHRAVLCPRSKYFAAACDGKFREAHTGIIELKDADAAAVERVLVYLYTLDYGNSVEHMDVGNNTSLMELDSSPSTEEDGQTGSAQTSASDVSKKVQGVTELVLHTHVYALADRFDVPDLKVLANERFLGVVKCQLWPPADFVAAALEVIRSTPSNDEYLRESVVELCAAHFNKTANTPAGSDQQMECKRLDNKDWEAVLKEDIDFTFDVMKEMVRVHHSSCYRQENSYKDCLAQLFKCVGREHCKMCGEPFRPLFHHNKGSNPPLDYQLRCLDCDHRYDIDEEEEE